MRDVLKLYAIMAFVWACLLGTAFAAELPPASQGTITLTRQIVQLDAAGTDPTVATTITNSSGTSTIYGPPKNRALFVSPTWFGAVAIDAKNPRVWPIENADGTPKQYTLFRIATEELQQDSAGYWFTENSTWQQFVTDGDVAALKAASWSFDFYLTASDPLPPEPEPWEPIVWEQRTPVLTVGTTSSNTLVIVKLNDTTGAWEWTIRGAQGVSGWTVASDEASARNAAEAQLRDGGG